MNRYRIMQGLIAKGDYDLNPEKVARLVRESQAKRPEMRSMEVHGSAKVRPIDWDDLAMRKEMRNMASDTAKLCHPILPPKTGPKPYRGERPKKFGHYCGTETYGSPVHG
jgi:hypothetical protein